MNRPNFFSFAALLAVSLTVFAEAEDDAVGRTYFRETVYPLLRENCFK